MGHSSGAISVAVHLLNGKSDRLFRNAVLLSPILAAHFKTFDKAVEMGQNLSQSLNCSPQDIACLQSKSPMEILDAQELVDTSGLSFLQRFMPWMPHEDGDEVPINILRAVELGYYTKKPILIGTTSSEGTSFAYNTFPSPLSRSAFAALLLMIKPSNAIELFRMYFPRNLTDAREDLSQLITDYVFTCPVRRFSQNTSTFTPTWLYVFEQPLTFLNGTGYTPLCVTRPCHGAELPYLFQTLYRRGMDFSPSEQRVADEFQSAITNFAKRNNPNDPSTPIDEQWPQYSSSGFFYNSVKVFSPMSRIETDYQGLLCGAFNMTSFEA